VFIITVVCLIAALAPGIGTVRNGARRWLQLGAAEWGISFQPSELAKLALVILLAAMLSGRSRFIRSFRRGLLPACVAIGCCVVLVGVEDFGTAALIAGVGAAMLLVGGARWLHLLLLSLPAAAGMVYLVLCAPYRVERLTTFLNIWADPRGAGYHPVQSLVTIASGGVTGRGLGAGVQKYGYLPESRSDFIYAVICEETGMIGAVLIIALFVALIWLGWRVVANERVSPFGRMLAFGVTFMFGLQALINIAVVLVCAPTKGISLPMVSAGGSGVVFLGIAMGLLVSAAREPDRDSPAYLESGARAAEVEFS
jgi:cell division protein FtsW